MSQLTMDHPFSTPAPSGRFKSGWATPIVVGHNTVAAKRARPRRGRRRRHVQPQLQKVLRNYRRQLRAQGMPRNEIRKRVHLRAQQWLKRAEDWRMNPAVSTRAMVPSEYQRAIALEPQKFTMGDFVPIKMGGPEPADGGQGTWLSPSQVPRRDLESSAQLMRQPESFGGMGGMGQPVPVDDLLRGEYARQLRLKNQQFNLQGMGQPVPVGSLSPGEYVRRIKLRQQFALSGMGQPVNPAAFRPGELGPLRTRGQRFDLGQPVPESAFVPGELERARRLVRAREAFSLKGMGQPVPIRAMRKGEFQPRLKLRGQQFDLADWMELSGMGSSLRLSNQGKRYHGQYGGPIGSAAAGKSAGQGTWLSPDQVPSWERESAASIAGPNEKFNLGDYEASRDVPIGSFRKGEFERRLRLKGQRFAGMGQLSPAAAAQMAALQAQAAAIAAGYVAPSTAKGGAYEGGARLYVDPTKALETAYVERQITLPKVCDPESGTCIEWKNPSAEVLKTAYVQGQMQLPAFYQHPTLGPWGVDPRQAYQYWAGQQAAIQAMPYSSPMAIFGSPGLTATTPGPLPGSNVATSAAFDPYTQAFPVAGQAVERF